MGDPLAQCRQAVVVRRHDVAVLQHALPVRAILGDCKKIASLFNIET